MPLSAPGIMNLGEHSSQYTDEGPHVRHIEAFAPWQAWEPEPTREFSCGSATSERLKPRAVGRTRIKDAAWEAYLPLGCVTGCCEGYDALAPGPLIILLEV
jgi:hypothetical protein